MAHSTVRTAFRTQIAAVLPVGWTYVETVNSTTHTDAGTKWITLEFLGGVERVVSIGGAGNNRHLEEGVVLIELRALIGAGNSDLESACDTIRAGFRELRSSHVKVYGVDPPLTLEDPPHYRAQIAVTYEFSNFG